ncbi:MAG: hypothetical protein QOJ12_2172 [Thermoleophilales bacterium]|jgi:quercetin dioxygenase-like cupin family protein|nr:hypothetical protein [Thermoleophilales bacterium]
MDVPNNGPERLCFVGRRISPAFQLRLITVAPGAERPYDADEWRGALVVVEVGEIELESLCGRRWQFGAGDVLWLADLPLHALHNPGSEPAVIAAVTKRDEFSAVLPSTPASDISRRTTT